MIGSDMGSRVADPPAKESEARWLLAIDSSTEQAGVALFDGYHLAELTWRAGRTQTTSVLGEIDHLLRLQGVALGDLAAIAVATGPGAFSGLRVGMGIAKGLVLARGLTLIGIPTLDVAAWPFAGESRPVVAVVAAGRGRLVWAVYGVIDGAWLQTVPPINGNPAELVTACAALGPGVTVTGELGDEHVGEMRRLSEIFVPSPALRLRRPGALAEIAWDRLRHGRTDDPATLAPVYLHGR